MNHKTFSQTWPVLFQSAQFLSVWETLINLKFHFTLFKIHARHWLYPQSLRLLCFSITWRSILHPKKTAFLLRDIKYLHSILLGRGTVNPYLMQALHFLTSFKKKEKNRKYSHDTVPFWPRSPVKPCCPGIPGGPGGPCSHKSSPKQNQERFNELFVFDWQQHQIHVFSTKMYLCGYSNTPP